MKFIDLFSGIGGFRLGMEQAGHECVGFCEIDKFARASYKAIHDTTNELEYHDITKVTDEQWRALHGTVDIICGGFPCQSFSIAGNRRGFEETRGTLFFQIARAVREIKPSLLFLENVKGLLSHNKGDTFRTILSTLDELGYDAEWQVLNSKDYGVPQHRERVFIIGHLRGECFRKVFPIRKTPVEATIQILAHRDGYRRNTQVFDKHGITETLDTGGGGGRGHYVAIKNNSPVKDHIMAENGDNICFQPSARGSVKKGYSGTITTTPDGVLDGMRIRRLTPRECWRLQGFPDWSFDKASKVNSDTQLYKQAGNSVTVPVIYAIAKLL